MNVILMGYMGSGKSTIGKDLARALQYEFIDLDVLIEEREGSSISDIFNRKGEVYFRKKEFLYLKELLEQKQNVVLSLGGGTPCYGTNMQLIKDSKDTVSLYLKLSIKTLTNRLYHEKNKRPLISHLDSLDALEEFIGKHLFERNFYYNQAQHRIDADEKSPEAIVEELVFTLLQ